MHINIVANLKSAIRYGQSALVRLEHSGLTNADLMAESHFKLRTAEDNIIPILDLIAQGVTLPAQAQIALEQALELTEQLKAAISRLEKQREDDPLNADPVDALYKGLAAKDGKA